MALPEPGCQPAVLLHSESCAAFAFSPTLLLPTAPALPSGYATVDKAEALTAPTPVLGKLGGGQTPLVGNAKVGAGSGWMGGCWCDGWRFDVVGAAPLVGGCCSRS